MQNPGRVAYFTMEIGLRPEMPTYSGGLGVLAGDAVRSAADLRIPMIAVTLIHRKGYFRQQLDEKGGQTEAPAHWRIESFLRELPARAAVTLEGRPVAIRAWTRDVEGIGGAAVPVLFLDTDFAENDAKHRSLTDSLYGGDARHRLCQEAVLGVGGIRMLRALGYSDITRYHMNEGHVALLAAELLREQMAAAGVREVTEGAIASVRTSCVFTTHTPVPAGHDRFSAALVREVLGRHEALERSGLFEREGMLNMTYAALNLSGYINGVAKRHGEVSRKMFGEYTIDSITNGVHLATWAAPAFYELYDRHIPGWRADNASLRFARHIPEEEVWGAHARCKADLLARVRAQTGVAIDPRAFTIAFGRRAAAYKRLDLLTGDAQRLRALASRAGPLQVVCAGKAHPRDEEGKRQIQRLFAAAEGLKGAVPMVYLADYDMTLARLMTAGADLWLNTPEPPLEASGTSGMKAAVNGVPSLSILDGWWVEGCVEGITGWAIGSAEGPHDAASDATALYEKLESTVLPMFYRERDRYTRVMRHAIALNASFFNTERMMRQYVVKAYHL